MRSPGGLLLWEGTVPTSKKPRHKMSKAKRDRLNPKPAPQPRPMFADALEAMKDMFKRSEKNE